MKTHRNRKRSIRMRIIGGCLVALLALPAAAGAMPQRDPSVALRQENGFPLAPVHERTPAQASPVVRTIKIGGSDTTLPTVLAAAALGIAFAGAGYVTLRLRLQPRSS